MPKLTPDQLHEIKQQIDARLNSEDLPYWIAEDLFDHIAHLETENAVLRAGRSQCPQ